MGKPQKAQNRSKTPKETELSTRRRNDDADTRNETMREGGNYFSASLIRYMKYLECWLSFYIIATCDAPIIFCPVAPLLRLRRHGVYLKGRPLRVSHESCGCRRVSDATLMFLLKCALNCDAFPYLGSAFDAEGLGHVGNGIPK